MEAVRGLGGDRGLAAPNEWGGRIMTAAETLTRALNGLWFGCYGTAPCPVCQPEQRRDQTALTITNRGDDHGLLLNCKKSNCAFRDILQAAGASASAACRKSHVASGTDLNAERQKRVEARSRQAERCWAGTVPLKSSVALSYLRARGISFTPSSALRYHPRCFHGRVKAHLPALVAKVSGSHGFGVHRTFLAPDGRGKAHVTPQKMMLGVTAGGYVEVAPGTGPLVIGEGIESTLSFIALHMTPDTRAFAALSAGNMPKVRLPVQAGRLVIAMDADDSSGIGIAKGHALAERARAKGWSVELAPAPQGLDWNDVLRLQISARVGQ